MEQGPGTRRGRIGRSVCAFLVVCCFECSPTASDVGFSPLGQPHWWLVLSQEYLFCKEQQGRQAHRPPSAVGFLSVSPQMLLRSEALHANPRAGDATPDKVWGAGAPVASWVYSPEENEDQAPFSTA